MRIHRCIVAGLVVGSVVCSYGAQAQTPFPGRPIRLVVPFAPGGVNDLIGRQYAAELARVLGGNVIVENRSGASGSIGAVEVARAKPDGYTLLLGGTTTHVINPAAMSKPAYDASKDFVPIGVMMLAPTGVAVHPSLPVQNLMQLVALAKAKPGSLSHASSGVGTVTHLTGELFKKLGGNLDMVHVPYKGAGPALVDLIAGHVPVMTPTISPGSLNYHQTRRMRLLAICSEERLQAAPDVPTGIQAGMPGLVVEAMIATFAPAGTAKDVVDQLSQAQLKVMSDPGFQAFLRKSGAVPVTTSTPELAGRFIKSEIERWTPIIRATGYKLD